MSAHQPHAHGELVNENVHHEESDINIRSIVTFVVVLTVIAVAIHIAMAGLFKLLDKIEDKTAPVVSPLTAPAALPGDFPQPRLQTTPWTDLRKLRAEEHTFVNGYGWVDESAGIAHVPIAKAKEMLLQKGIPVRPEVADAAEGTRLAATGESSGGRNIPAGGADKSTPGASGATTGAAPIALPGGGTGGQGASPAQQPGQPASAPAAKKPGGGGD